MLVAVNDTFMSVRSRQSMPISFENTSRTAPTTPNVEGGEKEKLQRCLSESGETSKNSAATGMRRRAFTNKASLVLRKSINGPDSEEQNQPVTSKNLRKILAKTSANNVRSCVLIKKVKVHIYIYSAP